MSDDLLTEARDFLRASEMHYHPASPRGQRGKHRGRAVSAVTIQLMSPALVEAMEDCARAIRRLETLTAERDSWPARMESARADARAAIRVMVAESKFDAAESKGDG